MHDAAPESHRAHDEFTRNRTGQVVAGWQYLLCCLILVVCSAQPGLGQCTRVEVDEVGTIYESGATHGWIDYFPKSLTGSFNTTGIPGGAAQVGHPASQDRTRTVLSFKPVSWCQQFIYSAAANVYLNVYVQQHNLGALLEVHDLSSNLSGVNSFNETPVDNLWRGFGAVPMFQGAGPIKAGDYIKIPLQGAFAAGIWLSTSYSKNGEVALGLKGFSDDISPLVIDGVGLSSLHAPFLTIEYPPGQRPSVPSGFVPVDGAVDVTGSSDLSWLRSSGSLPIYYDFYFGTTNPPPFQKVMANTLVPWVNLGANIRPNTKYYWKVVAFNFVAPEGVGSAVQSFTTAQSTVLISGIQSVPSGSTVFLSARLANTWSASYLYSYSWSAKCPTLSSNGTFSKLNASETMWTAPANGTASDQSCTISVVVTDDQGVALTGNYAIVVRGIPANTITITNGPSGIPNPVASGGTASLLVITTNTLNRILHNSWKAACPWSSSNGNFIFSSYQPTMWTAPVNTTGSERSCTISVTVSDDAGAAVTREYTQRVSRTTNGVTITMGPSGVPNPINSAGWVTLTVTASNPLNRSLSYFWSAECPGLPSNGSFSDPIVQSPTWIASDNRTGLPQSCTISVTASDGVSTATASYSQIVNPEPNRISFITGPTGSPNPVAAGGSVKLSVSATNTYNRVLSYAWRASCDQVISTGEFSDTTAHSPTWIPPTNNDPFDRECWISVTVTDGVVTSTASYRQVISRRLPFVTISSRANGLPNPVAPGGVVSLRVGVINPLNENLSYSWTAECPGLSSTGRFDNSNSEAPTWTAPATIRDTRWTCRISVIVSDSLGYATSDYTQEVSYQTNDVTITKGPSGSPNPVASGATANLSVSATNILNRRLSYLWSSNCSWGESNGDFSDITAQSPRWTAPINSTTSDQPCTVSVTIDDSLGTKATQDYVQTVKKVIAYSFVDRGGVSFMTPGTAQSATTGYAIAQPNAGETSPAGLARIAFRKNDVLISEASVPASPLLYSGRIYAESSGTVDTGLALANPGEQPAAISFYFSNATGSSGTGSVTILPHQQIAAFLSQPPFGGPKSLNGTFTFNSTAPVAAIALRGLTNERREFLITTLPVSDLNAARSNRELDLPDLADGGGWTTQIVLANTGDRVATGRVVFVSPSGSQLALTVNGQPGSTFPYSIPSRSSIRMQTAGTGNDIKSGRVRVVPENDTAAPSGFEIFSYRNGGSTVTEAGVAAVPPGNGFRFYGENFGPLFAPGSMQTGMAVSNVSTVDTSLMVELIALDGTPIRTGSLAVPAGGQRALFLQQISGFQTIPDHFQGIVRVTSSSPISVVGLKGQYNERNEFLISAVPAANEADPMPAGSVFFPHIIDGEGYTTQFILFGAHGLGSAGTLKLFSQRGDVLDWELQ